MIDIVIKDYMCQELKLGGDELILYAFFASYEEVYNIPCPLPMKVISKFLNISARTLYRVMRELKEKHLIAKTFIGITTNNPAYVSGEFLNDIKQ